MKLDGTMGAVGLALSLTLSACQAPGAALPGLGIQKTQPAVGAPDTSVPTGGSAAGTAGSTTVSPGSPAAAPPPPSSGFTGSGGNGGGNSSTPVLPASYFIGPNGQPVEVTASDVVALPAGLTGQVSLFMQDRIPSTIDAPGGALSLHPAIAGGGPGPSGSAIVQGAISTPQAGIIVQYLSAGRQLFAGATTDAGGNYSFQVPLDGTERGIVVAHDSQLTPDLDATEVNLSAGATAVVGPLTPAAPLPPTTNYRVLGFGSGGASTLPALPAGMNYSEGALQLDEGSGSSAWRANLVSLNAAPLPTYNLPGLNQVHTYTALSADNQRASVTSGAPGAVPDCLNPPDLSAVPATLSHGTAISWPAVSGASLYTLRLTPLYQANSPVWEGATQNTTLTLPANLSLTEQDLTLTVSAWDDAQVTLYSVASLPLKRNMQVPTDAIGPSGRHSWTLKAIHYLP